MRSDRGESQPVKAERGNPGKHNDGVPEASRLAQSVLEVSFDVEIDLLQLSDQLRIRLLP
jgi:hypothetical protein